MLEMFRCVGSRFLRTATDNHLSPPMLALTVTEEELNMKATILDVLNIGFIMVYIYITSVQGSTAATV